MGKKVIKLDVGTVYQKEEGGVYYFRYQLNGERKAVSLKTKDQKEAVKQAEALMPLLKAPSAEVVSAHVQHARGWLAKKHNLALDKVWEAYEAHPDRAHPATVHEHHSYRATFFEFMELMNRPQMVIREITETHAEQFARHLRTTQISVSTHNRKIKRLRKIFDVLREYREPDNPFRSVGLFRKEREEQEQELRRLPFSRDQEAKLLEVLDDPAYKVMNKPEVRVIYHLGMFTGQRLKDCVLLRWAKVDLSRRRVWVKQFKTGKEVTIPIAPKLHEVLQEALKWKSNDNDYVCPEVAARYNRTDADGKNVGNNLVNVDMLRVIHWIGLEPSVAMAGRARKVTIYGFHSLRHTFASHCAEAGVPKAVVLSILGTDSDIVDKYYTHIGDEAQEKAIAVISGVVGSKSDQDKLKEIEAIIDDQNLPAEKKVTEIRAIMANNAFTK